MKYLVVCTEQGRYVLTTRQLFPTREAAEAYTTGINASRAPLVVEVTEHQLATLRPADRGRI